MKTILIIEDRKIISDMYKFKLSKEGFEVIIAIGVDEAVELAKNSRPDLVILEVFLSKENGVDFLIRVREIEELNSLSVLVVSNFDDEETKIEAFKYGVKDYLIKSNHEPKEIILKIKELLNQ